MKSIIFIIKSLIPSPISRYRRLKRAKKENSRLSSLNCQLTEFHLRHARVLPDRLTLLSKLPQNGVVAEVGVADGDFSEKILNINSPVKLHLIDAWAMGKNVSYGGEPGYNKVKERFNADIYNGLVELHRGLSWDMLNSLPDKSLDWIYIDAAHDYDSVKKDLDAASKKIKDHGIIAGHDYVSEWGKVGARFGVFEAVNEFCLLNSYILVYITLESNHKWSYAIKKILSTEVG